MTSEKTSAPIEFDDLKQAKAWVRLLYQVSEEFSTSLDLDEVLGRVLSMTVKVVGATEGSIFLVNPRGEVTRSFIARAELPPEVRIPTIQTVMDEGFAAWVYHNNASAIIADTDEDERWVTFPDDRLKTRSAIGLPISNQEGIIGLLTLTKSEKGAFRDNHFTLLKPITEQAARAIDNAALYTRTRNERRTLDAVIHAVQEPILVFNPSDDLVLFNRAAENALNIDPQQDDIRLEHLITEPDLVAFIKDENKDQAQLALKNGRMYECKQAWIPALGYVVSLYDITTLKQLDQMKSEYVSHVSHDLKNPLSLIKGYAGVLPESPDQIEEYSGRILHAVDRMQELIDNILDMGAIEMGIKSEFEDLDLTSTIEMVIDELGTMANNRKIRLKNDSSDKPLKVVGAPVRIHQAISNLVGNALKFTPEGGEIEVGAQPGHGERVQVWVKDSGPGIPVELQSKLFQKFSKLGQGATQRNEGHGLGLAIVKAVADAHGGEVWVESRPDEGATFWFSLPVTTQN
jgi:signal transduction histidine kinase